MASSSRGASATRRAQAAGSSLPSPSFSWSRSYPRTWCPTSTPTLPRRRISMRMTPVASAGVQSRALTGTLAPSLRPCQLTWTTTRSSAAPPSIRRLAPRQRRAPRLLRRARRLAAMNPPEPMTRGKSQKSSRRRADGCACHAACAASATRRCCEEVTTSDIGHDGSSFRARGTRILGEYARPPWHSSGIPVGATHRRTGTHFRVRPTAVRRVV
mmetsp:Transcript_24043/g.65039  ORF Transcript_24043/g.65039 Transcript_24043/m.65039 type:complete len:214 (+) Transcript_24043:1926-2567(+)